MKQHIQLAEQETDADRAAALEEAVTAYEQAAEACQMAIEQFEARDLKRGKKNLKAARAMHEEARRASSRATRPDPIREVGSGGF